MDDEKLLLDDDGSWSLGSAACAGEMEGVWIVIWLAFVGLLHQQKVHNISIVVNRPLNIIDDSIRRGLHDGILFRLRRNLVFSAFIIISIVKSMTMNYY